MARKQARFGQPAIYNASLPTLTDGDDSGLNVDSSGRLISLDGGAQSQAIDSVLTYPRGSNTPGAPLTASGLVLTGAGKLTALIVTTASSTPTIKVWDNTAASGTVLIDTFTPVAFTSYPFPNIRVGTGIYITISGTVTVTPCYDPTTT